MAVLILAGAIYVVIIKENKKRNKREEKLVLTWRGEAGNINNDKRGGK